jgi:gliding motility-associated-like protein
LKKSVYIFFLLFLLCFCCETKSQSYFYTTSDDIITRGNVDNCHVDTINNMHGAFDIAITPNGKLYLLSDTLYVVDFDSHMQSKIGALKSLSGNPILGLGLIGVDDNYLLMDVADSLYKINTSTAVGFPIGKTGFYADGDFAFIHDTLYMTGGGNLLQIILNQTKTAINNVINIGPLSKGGFSLFTSFSCNDNRYGLYTIDKNDVYKINRTNANLDYNCSLPSYINASGACSLDDFKLFSNKNDIPNVFTPNNDGVNDIFETSFCNKIIKASVYNRWGTLVFETVNNNNIGWNGNTRSGEYCVEGTYFYIIETNEKIFKGFIQLLR